MDNVTVYEFLQEKGKIPTGPGHYNNSMEIANSIATSSASGGAYKEMVAGLIDGTLTDLIIPEGTTRISSVQFNKYQNLRTLSIAGSIKTVPSLAFNACTSLESVVINEGVTVIMSGAFRRCEALKEVTIPASVIGIAEETVAIPDVIDGAFTGCLNLETITINKPENSIAGAPWGATNATVVWTG